MKKLLLFAVIALFSVFSANSQITTYPYLEDFEAGAGGWGTTGTLWALGTPAAATINSANSGVNSWATNLTGNYVNSANEIVTSPVFDLTAVANPSISVSIWWQSENSWDGTVLQSSIDGGITWQNVGALGDPNNWFNDGTINGSPGGQQEGWTGSPGSAGWVTASHALTGLGGQASVILRFAFGSDGSVSSYDGFAFDDVTVFNVTCTQPTALNTSNVLDISADLNWTAVTGAVDYNVEWGTPGFIPGTGAGIGATSGVTGVTTPATGFTSATNYQFYVQTGCGASTSVWSGPFSFLTACGTSIAPWNDDVEAHTPSTNLTTTMCWSASATSGYDWNIDGSGSTPSSNTGPLGANSGTNYFYTEASGAAVGAEAILTSPNVDVSALTVPMIEFYYHMTGAQMGDLIIEAWDGTTWNTLDVISGEQQTAQADPWLRKAVYLSGYPSVISFRFRAISNGSFEGDISIDDIAVLEAPTCPEPSMFTITASDLVSGSMSWLAGPTGETEWELEYGTPGFTPGTGFGTNVITSNNPETISGLTSNSFYDVYIQGVCGAGDTSLVVGPISFNTYNQALYMDNDNACPSAGFIDISGTGTDIGMSDDNEMNQTLPFSFLYQGVLVNDIRIGDNGGVILGNTTGNISYGGNFNTLSDGYLFAWGDDMHPGSEGGGVFTDVVGTSPNQVYIVQWYNYHNYFGSVGSPYVNFEIQLHEATGEIFYVYDDVVFGGSNVNDDYGANADIGVSGPNQDITVSTNNTQYLTDNTCARFYYTNCPNPVNYTVTYTTNNEAGLSWSAGLANEVNWTIIYGVQGFDPLISGTTLNTTSPALILPGLNDITTYDVYIYADCNPGVLQSFGYMGTFTTLPNCSDPTVFNASTAVDSLMSTWLWVESSGIGTYPSTGFNVQYGNAGFGLYDGTQTIVNADNNYSDTTMDNTLLGGGVYEVYVQAVCGTDTSNWTGPVTFIMPIYNDSTCDAIPLNVDGTIYTFNNTGATSQVNENTIAPPATGFNTTDGWGNSAVDFTTWFTFTAPASGNMRISGKDAGFDGQMAVYEATDCSDLTTFTLMGANDDATDFSSGAPDWVICGLTAGNTYYLMHDSYSSVSTGTYSIRMEEVVSEAGTTNGIINVCTGDTANVQSGITGFDMGGVWTEEIPTASFSDSTFPSAGLAYQVFNFEYRVTKGCAIDSVIQQVQIYGPSSAGTDGTIATCQNQPVNLLSGLGGNVDLGGTWYNPSNNTTPSAIVTSSIPGSFNYDYITSNGICPSDTANVVVTVDPTCNYLNIDELVFGDVSVYPNPTSGLVYITNNSATEVFNYEVTDVNGRVIATNNAVINGTETSEVNLEKVEVGIYMIRLFNDNAEKTYRVIKQ